MAGQKGKGQRKYSEDEKLEIGKKICELYAQDYTIESCCKACGISDRSFLFWIASISELAELYKIAKSKQSMIFKERLRQKSDKALEKLVEGCEYDEIEESGTVSFDEDGKEVFTVKTRRVIKKKIQPNITAVIFSRINTNDILDPNFVNTRQNNKVDITSNGETMSGVVVLPAKEIEAYEGTDLNPIDNLLENADND